MKKRIVAISLAILILSAGLMTALADGFDGSLALTQSTVDLAPGADTRSDREAEGEDTN